MILEQLNKMKNVTIRLTTPEDEAMVSDLMEKYWGGEPLVVRTQNFYPSKLDGILAFSENKIVGFLFFDIQDKTCEIIVLEAFDQFKGIGTTLIDKLKVIAKEKNYNRLYLTTHNDNLDALRFYQRRGFHICAIHIDSVKKGRKMKPNIPMIGDYDIPIRDEIDLELILNEQ